MKNSAVVGGIATRYEVLGDGPPLLMYAPGGFDATIAKWRAAGVYERVKLLEHLPKKYRCIAFDRRECGESGGRIEPLTWRHYADHGKALLEHLGVGRAHLIGGCMGCSCVMAFAAAYPKATQSMILWWPVGGAKYRMKAHQRFSDHLKFVADQGLDEHDARMVREVHEREAEDSHDAGGSQPGLPEARRSLPLSVG